MGFELVFVNMYIKAEGNGVKAEGNGVKAGGNGVKAEGDGVKAEGYMQQPTTKKKNGPNLLKKRMVSRV